MLLSAGLISIFNKVRAELHNKTGYLFIACLVHNIKADRHVFFQQLV